MGVRSSFRTTKQAAHSLRFCADGEDWFSDADSTSTWSQASLLRLPNKVSISIYNLGPNSRALVSKLNNLAVLEAGYGKNVQQIFKGQINFAKTEKHGPELHHRDRGYGRSVRISKLRGQSQLPVTQYRIRTSSTLLSVCLAVQGKAPVKFRNTYAAAGTITVLYFPVGRSTSSRRFAIEAICSSLFKLAMFLYYLMDRTK